MSNKTNLSNASGFKIGDSVDFHSVIGGPVTSTDHVISHIEMRPNNFGSDVAWITGRVGCVALDALSNAGNPPVITGRYEKIKRSK